MVAPVQLSVGVGTVQLAVLLQALANALTVTVPGHVMAGGVASLTVTVNEQVDVWLAELVAV